jgi:L-lactate dehydrogenase complex protein LldG
MIITELTMSSREKILEKIKINKPVASALPSHYKFESQYGDLETKFKESLELLHTELMVVKDMQALREKIKELYTGTSQATTLPELADWADFSLQVSDPHDLEHLEFALLRAQFGVAENGAIWLSDQDLPHRVLPFITQNLAFVIRKDALVANMHDAYDRLQDTEGWGCFIAGPSKTADIEQSLVIGAHGARSLIVFLLENE